MLLLLDLRTNLAAGIFMLLAGATLASDVPVERSLALGRVSTATFNADGTLLLTAYGSQACVWNVADGHLLRSFDFPGDATRIFSARFSPDQSQVLFGTGSASPIGSRGPTRATIWERSSGRLIASLALHGTVVESAQFSPDGKRLLTVSTSYSSAFAPGDRTKAVMWDHEARRPQFAISGIATYANATRSLVSVEFSPSGDLLAGLTSEGRVIRCWDARTGDVLSEKTNAGDIAGFGDFQFSPDGKLILAACGDNRAEVWDARNGQLLSTLKGHTDALVGVAFCGKESQAITASMDGTARLFDVATGRQVRAFSHAGQVRAIAVSADGSRLACKWCKPPAGGFSDNRSGEWLLTLWDVRSGKAIRQFDLPLIKVGEGFASPNGHVVFTSDSKRILARVVRDGGSQTVLLDASSGDVVRRYE
jgi:WD40 repeat protein